MRTNTPFEGVTTIGALASRLSSYFAPASYLQAPKSSPASTGGRTVAATNKQLAASKPRPSDAAAIALVAGTLTWNFSTKFVVKPIVTWGAAGAPPSAGTTLYVDVASFSNTTVIIKSTDATDHRTVYLQAQGNPN